MRDRTIFNRATATRAPVPLKRKHKRGKGNVQHRTLPSGLDRYRARYQVSCQSKAGPWRTTYEEALRDLERHVPRRRIPKCPCGGCGVLAGFCVAHLDVLHRIREEFLASESGFHTTDNPLDQKLAA